MVPPMVDQALTPINKGAPWGVGSYFLAATEELAQHCPIFFLN